MYELILLTLTPGQIISGLWLLFVIAPIIIIPLFALSSLTRWLQKAKEKGRKTSGTVIEKKAHSKEKHKRYKLLVSYTGDDGLNHLATIDGDIELKDINVGQSVQIIYVPGKYQTIMLVDRYRTLVERM